MQIAATAFDYKYSLRGLPEYSDEYRRVLSEVHSRSAKRILRLCELNRGFYVKAGQFVAAMRQVPKEYSSTLSSLQDQTAPCPFKAIKEVLVRNLGADLSEIFISFDEQPVAAASIAQVHHAVLKDHQEVAVKVQYPGLEKQMHFDLGTMSLLSNLITWLFPEYRFGWIVSEFAKSISSELDFTQEARNSERAAKNFKGNSTVKIPHVFWDLTTTKVLTMQFCKGQKVDNLEFLKEMGISPTNVAKALSEMVAEMIFVHGFLHGDLHPGNILVSQEGASSFSLVLLDHGICKELDETFRVNYCELWKALIFMDSNKIQQLGEQMGVSKYARYFPVIFTGRTINSKTALGRGMSVEEKNNLKQELKSLKMEDISSFMESLPSDFLTVLRADGLLRSLLSKLGAPHRIRLRAYAKYAFQGVPRVDAFESGVTMGAVLIKLESKIKDIQLSLMLGNLSYSSLIIN
ncbi:OLC1v1010306C1 [Oldenlandia corymbosa var. corymbosa]|uniref:OLC1v1010306C1 n=1 Tax=Oldenlandia corymbosa var. corymbosa TaxID=529605 RepID=A0AAV1DR13_OLDCO|nr:OLC1v1010306C1 [Oldenlandia corymbosa var. corymbosa]